MSSLLAIKSLSLKVHESPPPYSDTGHEVLPDIVVNINQSSQIESTSRSNESLTISVISSDNPERDVISDNKEDRAVHM